MNDFKIGDRVMLIVKESVATYLNPWLYICTAFSSNVIGSFTISSNIIAIKNNVFFMISIPCL